MGVRLCVLCLLILLNCMLCYKAVWGENGLIDHGALKEQQLAVKTDPAYVEKVIRQRLNYVRKNEILYLFDEADTASGGAQ